MDLELVDTNVEALQEIDQASPVGTEPVHTEQSLERLYEQWSSTRFQSTVLEIARQAVEGKASSDELLARVDGYLAQVALEQKVNPPGEAYNLARRAVGEKINELDLQSDDQAIDEIREVATAGAATPVLPSKPPETDKSKTEPGPKLEGVPLPLAIVNYLSSLPDGLLERGDYKSAGSIIFEKLRPFGHSQTAVRNAVRKLVDDGLVTQQKTTPNSRIVNSLQLENDAKQRVERQLQQARMNHTSKKDRVYDFIYKGRDGRRLSVDLNKKQFMELPVQDRFLIIAAKFQNIRFLNGSIYESLLKATNLKEKEDATDIDLEKLVVIDERSVKLTEAGENLLRKVKVGVTSMFIKPKEPRLSKAKNGGGENRSAHENASRADPEIAKLLADFKGLLINRGAGIMPTPDESVTKQFNNLCITELGASPEFAVKLYNALKNDPQILKLSFKEGSQNVVQYVGMAELQDDPITRGQTMIGDLRTMLDDYDSLLRNRNLAFDPKIQIYRALCEIMTRKDWLEYPYGDLEQYSGQLLAAMREIAQARRELTAR